MDKIAILLALMSFVTACGGRVELPMGNADIEPAVVADSPKLPEPEPVVEVEPEPEPVPVPKPEPEREHSISGDFSHLSNEGSGWGFVKKKGQEPGIYDSTRKMFEKYDTYYMDPARTNKIYLTFDEGYENGYTGQILDTLAEYDVPAAFFITGDYIQSEPELVDRMVEEGHIVGNHTENHPNLPKLADPEKIAAEYETLNKAFRDRYGENMYYMRPPEGEYSERMLAITQNLGYKTVLWSFAYKDWDTKDQKGADYAYNQVTPYLHNGCIILLHAVSRDNTEALPRIIEYARAAGYEFASLDDIGQ